jgi:phage terminase large subunit
MIIQTTKVFSEIDTAVNEGYTTVSLQGSSRSSKTYNTLIWLIVYCLKRHGTRLSVVRATLPAIKGSVFIDFKEILMNMLLFDEKALNKTELTYHFPNGSWVEFFSTDSEQKLRGRKRDILFVNEANELSFIEWQQLKMRTTRLAIVDYNPSFTDEHWICRLNIESRTKHVITTYKDNPFLEQTIIDEIESLQHKNESLWKIYGLGVQAQIEGLIFRNVELIEEMPPAKRRFVGMDFGFSNDPTAIVDVVITKDTIYLDEVCYRTEMVARDIIQVLKGRLPDRRIISESADPRLIKEIHNAGINIIPVEKFPGSVEAGITKMLEYRICVTKNSYNIIKELKNYTYQQDKEGKWLNKPIDAFNHAMDACRYIILEEVLGRNKTKLNTMQSWHKKN